MFCSLCTVYWVFYKKIREYVRVKELKSKYFTPNVNEVKWKRKKKNLCIIKSQSIYFSFSITPVINGITIESYATAPRVFDPVATAIQGSVDYRCCSWIFPLSSSVSEMETGDLARLPLRPADIPPALLYWINVTAFAKPLAPLPSSLPTSCPLSAGLLCCLSSLAELGAWRCGSGSEFD